MTELQLHPLCTLFPRMTGAEFDALVADIAANGQRQPIVVHDGMILDGGNRYRACLIAGVEPLTVPFAGGNLVSFVLSQNMHRRHMTPGQQAAIVAAAQDWAQAHGHGGARRVDQAAILPLEPGNDDQAAILPLASVADRAAQSGASERTQRMADKVAQADPDLVKEVAQGNVSLPAAVEKVTGKRPGTKRKHSTCDDDSPGGASGTPPGQDEFEELRARFNEQGQQIARLLADNNDMGKIFDADDRLAAAMAENDRLKEVVRVLESRIRGLMNEKNEAVRLVKSLQRRLSAAGVAA